MQQFRIVAGEDKLRRLNTGLRRIVDAEPFAVAGRCRGRNLRIGDDFIQDIGRDAAAAVFITRSTIGRIVLTL